MTDSQNRRVGKARCVRLPAWAKSFARFAHAQSHRQTILPTLRTNVARLPLRAFSVRGAASVQSHAFDPERVALLSDLKAARQGIHAVIASPFIVWTGGSSERHRNAVRVPAAGTRGFPHLGSSRTRCARGRLNDQFGSNSGGERYAIPYSLGLDAQLRSCTLGFASRIGRPC